MARVVAVVAAAVALAACHSAQALDLKLSPDNIYLRLDSGYSWSRSADQSIGNGDVGDSIILGFGVGYRWTDHIRTDLTFAYRGWYQIKDAIDTSFVFPTSTGARALYSGPADAKANVQEISGLFNVYYDIARFGIVTPYLGGGVGFTYNNMQTLTLNVGGDVGTVGGNSGTDVAWQFCLGAAIDVAPNTIVDFGYRYINMGRVSTTSQAVVLGIGQTVGKLKADLQANELQFGLRYTF